MERPYRLWNENEKVALKWRYYAYKQNAHIAALIECRWAKVGTVIAIYHTNSAKLHGQYKRTLDSVSFLGEANIIAKPKSRPSNVHPIRKTKETVDKETGEIRRSNAQAR